MHTLCVLCVQHTINLEDYKNKRPQQKIEANKSQQPKNLCFSLDIFYSWQKVTIEPGFFAPKLIKAKLTQQAMLTACRPKNRRLQRLVCANQTVGERKLGIQG